MIDAVVIGRNDSGNLKRIFTSLEPLVRDKTINKIIYIDSNSKDESVLIAKKYVDTVYKIVEEEICSASLARNIGTQISMEEWILYLDSDMIIHPDFIEWIKDEFLSKKDLYDGFIGNYIMNNIDDNGKILATNIKTRKNKIAEYLAGSSLLKKEAVMKSGNWGEKLFSTEEQDLYTRMRMNGFKIYEMNVNQIEHFDKDFKLKYKLKELYFPINKKNYMGTFQGFYKALKERNYLHFSDHIPQYITFLSLINALIFPMKFKKYFLCTIIIFNKCNLKRIVVNIGNSTRLIYGIFNFSYIRRINRLSIKGEIVHDASME